jgi:hypothetical protein
VICSRWHRLLLVSASCSALSPVSLFFCVFPIVFLFVFGYGVADHRHTRCVPFRLLSFVCLLLFCAKSSLCAIACDTAVNQACLFSFLFLIPVPIPQKESGRLREERERFVHCKHRLRQVGGVGGTRVCERLSPLLLPLRTYFLPFLFLFCLPNLSLSPCTSFILLLLPPKSSSKKNEREKQLCARFPVSSAYVYGDVQVCVFPPLCVYVCLPGFAFLCVGTERLRAGNYQRQEE